MPAESLYSPSYIKQLCQELGIRPSKKYGQNYLISSRPIEHILEAGEIDKKDTVVEVGPGFGVLTLAMAETGARIYAFEIEKKLLPYWEEKQKKFPNLSIEWGNVLTTFDQTDISTERYKVIANIPYQITSRLIRTFLERENPPERMILMVQKEVAERICAKPGDMSLLAISVQYFGKVHIVTKVPKGNFSPAPKVDSAIIAITDIQKRKDSDIFFTIVRAAFANKRKQAWRNISTVTSYQPDRVKEVLAKVTGSEKIRAEMISIEQWHDIVAALEQRER